MHDRPQIHETINAVELSKPSRRANTLTIRSSPAYWRKRHFHETSQRTTQDDKLERLVVWADKKGQHCSWLQTMKQGPRGATRLIFATSDA